METDAWTVIRYLHVLALAFFVGGQLLLVAAIVPVLRGGDDSTMRAVARRFGSGSLIALLGVLTGLHIATPNSRGVSIAVLVSSQLVVWLGVALTH